MNKKIVVKKKVINETAEGKEISLYLNISIDLCR